MNIIVGFSRPKKFKVFSWLIRKLGKTESSHTYIKIYSQKYDRNLIYHASELRVSFWNEQVFLAENIAVKEFSLTVSNENYIKILQFAIDHVGEKYALKPVIGLGLRILGIKVPKMFRTTGWYCSKIVAYILEIAELEDFKNADIVLLSEISSELER